MSSPNLNALTLFGSILTYASGFLFAMDDRSPLQTAGPRAVLQVRLSHSHTCTGVQLRTSLDTPVQMTCC